NLAASSWRPSSRTSPVIQVLSSRVQGCCWFADSCPVHSRAVATGLPSRLTIPAMQLMLPTSLLCCFYSESIVVAIQDNLSLAQTTNPRAMLLPRTALINSVHGEQHRSEKKGPSSLENPFIYLVATGRLELPTPAL